MGYKNKTLVLIKIYLEKTKVDLLKSYKEVLKRLKIEEKMFKLDVIVKLKKDVLDPQGKAIEQAAKNINLNNIYSVKQNKYFESLSRKST